MRTGAVIVLLAVLSISCGGGELFRQYEYEEEIYLSLDGSATVYVNSSVAALDALRGASFDTNPPATRVTRSPTLSRRSTRRFVHVRIDVDDVRRMSDALPFAWSTYQFTREGDLWVYRQRVGTPSGRVPAGVNWNGSELVAFRLHVPSRVQYHNAGAANLRRGNILVWEQSLKDRLAGAPLEIDARMESQSILYRTLFLFGATFVAVALLFVVVIWWIVRRGGKPAQV
jgi:hypothetical protein